MYGLALSVFQRPLAMFAPIYRRRPLHSAEYRQESPSNCGPVHIYEYVIYKNILYYKTLACNDGGETEQKTQFVIVYRTLYDF